MNAQEQAKKMTEKFLPFDISEYDTDSERFPIMLARDMVIAKRHANICADELIETFSKYTGMYEQEVFDAEKQFWQTVKTEIEKL